MPVIEPVRMHDLPQDLSETVSRGRASRMLSSTTPVQIWAHRPKAAHAWLKLIEEIHLRGVLDDRLRELIRLKIAAITTCKACQIARKSDDVSEEDIACLTWSDPRFSPAEQAALHYAELFAADYMSIDDAIYDELAKHFTTEQIVEINMFSALMLAGGRMTYVQRGYDDDGVSYRIRADSKPTAA